jgi:hypothetical protein
MHRSRKYCSPRVYIQSCAGSMLLPLLLDQAQHQPSRVRMRFSACAHTRASKTRSDPLKSTARREALRSGHP